MGFALFHNSPPSGGEREPPPGEAFMQPARGVGTRRPLCRREHRGLMCGEGVPRACGRQGPGGEQ